MVTQTDDLTFRGYNTLWEGIAQSETPGSVKIEGGKYTVHAQGTFGGGSVELQYSSDNSDFTSIDSTNLTFTAEGVYNFELAHGWVKPILTGGDGTTDIDVRLKPIPNG